MSAGDAKGLPDDNPLCAQIVGTPRSTGLADECLADRRESALVIVEPPRVPIVLEDIREVGERLPRRDRVGPSCLLNRLEVRLDRADVGKGLGVQEDPLVPTQRLGDPAGLLHDSMESGLPSGWIGSADSTSMEVSLLRNMSSRK